MPVGGLDLKQRLAFFMPLFLPRILNSDNSSTMTAISVERSGKEIGDFSLQSVNEGLASGYFLPDDYGWYEGLTEWILLPEIVKMLGDQPVSSEVEVSSSAETNLPLVLKSSDPTFLYTLFRGRGPAKMTQIFGATYFYRGQEGKIEGPFNKLEMRGLLRKKIVEPETLVLCPATQQWLPSDRFPELPKPAHNKLLHFEKDSRFANLVNEIPQMIVAHISGKLTEGDLSNWLVLQVRECGYQCPDYDQGTINDLLYEDRVKLIIRKNRETWAGYIQYSRGGGNILINKPELIGF